MASSTTADPAPSPDPDLDSDPDSDPDPDLDSDPDLSVGACRLRRLETACRRRLLDCGSEAPERLARLHNRLGLLLYGQVRFDEAAAAYTAALDAWPRLGAAAHNRAVVRYRMGESTAAAARREGSRDRYCLRSVFGVDFGCCKLKEDPE